MLHDKIDDRQGIYDVQGLPCHIPPVGYVYDRVQKEFVYTGVESRSDVEEEQYWERKGLPELYDQRKQIELDRREINPEYIDPELLSFEEEAWFKRINGMWFMNNGEPTYITGLNYFFLEWVYIGIPINNGYPSYRTSDKEFFYFLQNTVDQPESYGMLYVTKRREGKTAKSAAFLLDLPTRMFEAHSGIQSKTSEDASKVVYLDTVVKAFHRLPEFFRPIYDTSGGSRPKSGLNFTKTAKRGKQALAERDKPELGGWIQWRSSKATAFDGTILHRYVADEVFKTVDVNVENRHSVAQFCVVNGETGLPLGKMLYTSTVEEMEGEVELYRRMWDGSNHLERDPVTKETSTGLYRYFLPADEAQERDKYGNVDKEANRSKIMAKRAQLEKNPAMLQSFIRKNPLNWMEAFRYAGDNSCYDNTIINEQIDNVAWQSDEIFTKGNFEEDEYGYINFKESDNGRFKVLKAYLDNPMQVNQDKPSNNNFSMGADTFDHNTTEDSRRSDGAIYVVCRNHIIPQLNMAFVCQYLHRPKLAEIFFKDLAYCAKFFGSKAMVENNRIGCIQWMQKNGYNKYLFYIAGQRNAGIAGSKKSHMMIYETTNDYINEHIGNCNYLELLEDWLRFDLSNTQKFDASMAAGYALIHHMYNAPKVKRNATAKEAFIDPKKLFGKRSKLRRNV